MPYIYCAPALVTELRHGLDNIVRGEVEIDGVCLPFVTRGHIVKATNKHYRGASWKPAKGSYVLIDGDLCNENLIVDHIEGCVTMPPATDPLTIPATLREAIERTNGASKVLRTGRYGGVKTFRFAQAAAKTSGREAIKHLIHGKIEADGWRFWTKTVEGGRSGEHGWSEWIEDAALSLLGLSSPAAQLPPKPLPKAASANHAAIEDAWDSVPF